MAGGALPKAAERPIDDYEGFNDEPAYRAHLVDALCERLPLFLARHHWRQAID
jgi:hypothetical protein